MAQKTTRSRKQAREQEGGESYLKPALIASGAAAAAAGLAAGYYFYASKNAKRNRRIAAAWAGDMRDEVVERMKKLGEVSREDALAAIDTVARTYESIRGIDPDDVRDAAQELRDNWGRLASDVRKEVRRSGSTVRKAVTPKKRRRV